MKKTMKIPTGFKFRPTIQKHLLFYFAEGKKSKKITAGGFGKNDGSITLSHKHWSFFINSLLPHLNIEEIREIVGRAFADLLRGEQKNSHPLNVEKYVRIFRFRLFGLMIAEFKIIGGSF